MEKKFEQVEDLLTDEDFLTWFYKTDAYAVSAWESKMHANPALQLLSANASVILASLPLDQDQVNELQADTAHKRLMVAIGSDKKVFRMLTVRRKWLLAAVAASVLVFVSIGIIRSFKSESYIKTSYGQVKAHILPDGSEVTLNANSKITVSDTWEQGKDREVWLNGEAYFHVKHTENHRRFIVHTNNFDIIVRGTRFNVVNRNDRNNVLLKEGSVIIRSGSGDELYMKPGEFINVVKKKLEKRPVKESKVMAWTHRKIEFENTSMKEVAEIIRDHYGVDVKLETSSVADKKISGILPNDNLDVLLQTLQALDFVIEHEENLIVIGEK